MIKILEQNILKKNDEMRINKYLAIQGISTRRDADKMVSAGKITINGRKAILGDKVKEGDKVEIIKKIFQNFVYYAYNKPKGIITHSPQNDEKDIHMSAKLKNIFPVGRLDKDSEGLIILTNDGRITDRLLNSKYEHEKEYIIQTRTPIKENCLKKMEKGMDLEGISTNPCKIKLINEKTFSIILSEGKKHQIRRMCDALAIQIESLKRVKIINIKLEKLKPNMYRKIEGKELKTFIQLLF